MKFNRKCFFVFLSVRLFVPDRARMGPICMIFTYTTNLRIGRAQAAFLGCFCLVRTNYWVTQLILTGIGWLDESFG